MQVIILKNTIYQFDTKFRTRNKWLKKKKKYSITYVKTKAHINLIAIDKIKIKCVDMKHQRIILWLKTKINTNLSLDQDGQIKKSCFFFDNHRY